MSAMLCPATPTCPPRRERPEQVAAVIGVGVEQPPADRDQGEQAPGLPPPRWPTAVRVSIGAKPRGLPAAPGECAGQHRADQAVLDRRTGQKLSPRRPAPK